jgi:methionyl-tRNA synthetase
VNKDLADTLGNFVLRTCSFIQRFFKGQVPAQTSPVDEDREIVSRLEARLEEARENLEGCQFQKAVRSLRSLWADCNWYFDVKKPWAERKTDPEKAGTTLGLAANLCRSIAILSAPFIPDTAEQIFAQLGVDENVHALGWDAALDTDLITGKTISGTLDPLVSKIESEKLEELAQRFAGAREK